MSQTWYALVKDGVVQLKVRVEDLFLDTLLSSERVDITGIEDTVEADYIYENGAFTAPVR